MESENLLDSFKDLLTLPLAHQASQLLGQPVDGVGTGVEHLLPHLLGAIVHRGSNSNEGSAALRDLLNSSSVDTDLLSNNAGDVLAGGPQTDSLLEQGKSQLEQLFGAKQSNLYDAAAKIAGVNAAQGATLAAAGTPFALALMKRSLSPAGGPISPAQLARFLDAQKKRFGGLSEVFFAALGLGSLGAWLAAKPVPVPAKPVPPLSSASASAAAPAKKGHKWLLWLLLAALIVALLAWCTQHGSGTSDQATSASAASDALAASSDAGAAAVPASSASAADQSTQATSGAVAADTGSAAGASSAAAASTTAATDTAATSTATPTTASIAATTGAAAAQSSDAGLPLKVYFATGKAGLNTHFHKDAQAVVEYAKAHPDAKFAVTGYTDARGRVPRNIALAKRRAEAVVHALAADGVAASRLSIERPATAGEETGGSGQEGRRVEVSVQQ